MAVDDGVEVPRRLGKPITYLFLEHNPLTDDDLKRIAALGHLQELHLGRTSVTDAGLAALAGLTSLERTRVTDAGLKALAGLRNLRFLGLSGTRVTDAGLRELGALSNLAELDLRGTEVTAPASSNSTASRASGPCTWRAASSFRRKRRTSRV